MYDCVKKFVINNVKHFYLIFEYLKSLHAFLNKKDLSSLFEFTCLTYIFKKNSVMVFNKITKYTAGFVILAAVAALGFSHLFFEVITIITVV